MQTESLSLPAGVAMKGGRWLWRLEPSILIDEANPHCVLILARAAVSVRKVTND